MPFTKFTNLDFDQIKASIKDYLRANSNFTDFDFEGSNFSVLIDTLAYNTYITAFNSNMIVNESFLDSATLRENVVSLARNIGYVPRSRKSAEAHISFDVDISTETLSPTITLKAGLVCVGRVANSSYVFSIPNDVTTTIKNNLAQFTDVSIFQGTFLKKEFVVDGSLDQRFILENSFIDRSTIRVYVKSPSDSGLGFEYQEVDNILTLDGESKIYLTQEIQDEKYEIIFGDGVIGQKLENGSVITATYIITDGIEGNGASQFSFAGSFRDSKDAPLISDVISITTLQSSQNGADIESVDSIKYFAPRLYSSQYRAVTSRDYEAIIKSIYPDTESVSVVGGEDLDPPEYGTVNISIKPKNGTFVSDFNKEQILSKLKQYSISGINQKIVDLKLLYVEIDASVYYNYSLVSSVDSLKSKVTKSLNEYSNSVDLNKFGGRFKYSNILQIIDNTDSSITSNITKVKIRRDLKVIPNSPVTYELCFGNRFHIVNPDGYNIKSSGFKVFGNSSVVYVTDEPNKTPTGQLDGSNKGKLYLFKFGSDNQALKISGEIGFVDYEKGELILGSPEPVIIESTVQPFNIIEVQAFPDSNDVVGLKDLYIYFDVSKSQINMVKDVIASGDNISGVTFTRDFYTSSYSNGDLTRS